MLFCVSHQDKENEEDFIDFILQAGGRLLELFFFFVGSIIKLLFLLKL